MFDTPESPNGFASAVEAPQQDPFPSLVQRFEDFANSDAKYQSKRRAITGLEPHWHDHMDNCWRVTFEAVQFPKQPELTAVYDLDLKVNSETQSLTDELRALAADRDVMLPADEDVHSVSFTHNAYLSADRDFGFAWNVFREYVVVHSVPTNLTKLTEHQHLFLENAGLLEGFVERVAEYLDAAGEADGYDDEDDQGEVEEGARSRYAMSMSFGEVVSMRTMAQARARLEAGPAAAEVDIDIMFGDVEADMYARLAHEVFTIFMAGDEGDFELCNIFPTGFLAVLLAEVEKKNGTPGVA